MKLFQSVQESFAILGITLEQSVRSNPFNERILAALSSYLMRVILFTVSLFHDAETFSEYTENIWLNSAAILVLVAFAVMVFNKGKFFALIDNSVTVVANSK